MGFLDTIGADKFLPDVSWAGVGTGLVRSLTIFFLMVFFAIILGVIGYYIMQLKKYRYRVHIYRETAGYMRLVRRDRAMTVKMGDGGEVLLWLKKTKEYKNAYGEQDEKNLYKFVIHADGYWYNVRLGSLDASLKEMKLLPTDPAMRLLHSGVRRNVQQNFDKKNWIKENIGMLVSIFAIVIVLVFMWLLADKWLTINATAVQTMEMANKVLDRIGELLTATDNLCSSGVITK